MPLKCLQETAEIYAPDVPDDAAWEQLRKVNRASKALRMPCCGASVVLKESKLGTRYFAHARRGPCTTAPESAEHLLAKSAVVRGIRQTAWNAFPEQGGETPTGDPWRADVLAVKGTGRVAFEIQWSRQDADETERRQARYAAAGVRGLWFFRQHDFPVAKDTPAFRLAFEEASREFRVLLPSPDYSPNWMNAREAPNPRYWQQSIELPAFVSGALRGRLKFAPVLGQCLPLEVETAPTTCWRCKRKTRVVTELAFAASRVFPHHPDIPVSLHDFVSDIPEGERILTELFPAALLRSHGIGVLKSRYSKTARAAYFSNGCMHCDALQGHWFEGDLADESTKTFEVETVFREDWGPLLKLVERHIYRWWFDAREA
jgi:hypothetical protein